MKHKKLIIIVAALILLFIIISSCGNETVTNDTETTEQATTETTEEITEQKVDEDTGEDYSDYLKDEISLSKPWDSVRNDKTGDWRLAECSTSVPIEDFAVKYYKTYFESDDEVHAIINFGTNKTYKLTVLDGETLQVDTYDYVDGEEHDANILFSGYYYDPRWFDIKTGKEIDL